MTDQPKIFIAMPLFEGWDHVAHTLETVQKQTYRNYRVLISVDGGDIRSYQACERFLADSRFEIVVQQERLGWAGNMNYLANRLDCDYFCYWQHDDYCAPTYLQTLMDHAVIHPEAATIYCDMKIFGEWNRVQRSPSVTGFDLERVLDQVRRPNDAAIRCLIRADALRASLPIQLALTWVLPLARSGEFHRVPELLYFRRIRKKAYTLTLPHQPPLVRWRASMDWALAVLANVRPLIRDHEATDLFAWVVEMLTSNGYWGMTKYNLEAASRALQVKFVRQMLDEIDSTHGYRPWPDVSLPDLERTLKRRLYSTERLRKGEALLIEAAIACNVLPDEAVVTGHVPLPDPNVAMKEINKDNGAERSKPRENLWRRAAQCVTRHIY